MNEDHSEQNAPDIDPQVSEYFRTRAVEAAPAHLDRAVLREAKRAVRAGERKSSKGAWFRPLAFVVTVGLALAIVIDVGKLGIVAPPESEFEPGQPAPDHTSLNDIKRQEKSGANGGTATAGDAAGSREGRAGKLGTEPAPASTPSERRAEAVSQSGCTVEQQSAPELWWACIVSLRESGRSEVAELELDRLRKNFPAFARPE